MQLFWRLGYEGAHLAALVEHTGLNRFSLYKEFGGKAGLYEAALERFLGYLLAQYRDILTRQPLGLENIEAVLRALQYGSEYYGCFMINTLTQRDTVPEGAYGKALAGAGQFEPALDAVRRAQTPEYPDWKLLSAEGAILDQLGKQAEARALYRKALDLKPNEPSVMSNLGMSYVLEGDLRTAEVQLRSAAQAPGADSRVRQNLALVVGLQGRFEEAEQIARQELSPDQAKANVDYLRSMLAQQNAWSQIKEEDKPTTN